MTISCKKLHFFTCEVQGQLSKQKISVTSMKLHFITFEVKGPRSISKVCRGIINSKIQVKFPKRSKVQGQTKVKFGDLYFHENTLQAAQKNSTVNTIQLKYDVSCKKLHFFTCEVQGQLSKEKQKISVTSMKLHFITFEVKGPRSISKVNYHFEPPPAISCPSSLLIWPFVFSRSNSISFTLQIY